MDMILWLMFGVIVDWVASFFTHSSGRQAMLKNVAVISASALVSALLLTPILRHEVNSNLNVNESSLLISFLSALQ